MRKSQNESSRKPEKLRSIPTSGPRGFREAAPFWNRYCGYCAMTTRVATNGRDLVCMRCGS